MATSGSSDFNLTRDGIITRALELINAISPGDTPGSSLITNGATALNSLVKSWQSEGVGIWGLEWKTKTLTAATVITGTDALNYTCIKSHISATTNKPVTGADWASYWVQKGTGGVAWADATAYSSIGDFTSLTGTIDIINASIRRNGVDYPLEILTAEEYLKIPNKAIMGLPQKLWFNYLLSSQIYLYPQPDSSSDILHYLRLRLLEDFDATGDNPDFPVKWLDALTFGLAYKLSFTYGVAPDIRQSLLLEMERLKGIAQQSDTIILKMAKNQSIPEGKG